MSLSINLNASALNAHNALASTNSALGKSIAKLSSGYKINNASDDPAGLVISENLRAQMGGLTQAVSNSQDAVNMVKTAEGALTEVNTLLGSMRILAVHAASLGSNSASSVAADQAQIASAMTSLGNISKNTAFGNLKLLDGNAGAAFTVLDPTKVTGLSVGSGASIFQGKTGAVNITANAATQTALAGSISGTGGTNATNKIAADDTIVINGVKIGDFTAAANSQQNVIDAINGKTTQTGVTAAYNTGTHSIDLKSVAYGSAQTISLSETGASIGTGGGLHTGVAGTNAQITAMRIGTYDLTAADLATFSNRNGNTISNSAGDTVTLAPGASGGTAASFSGYNASKIVSATVGGPGSVFVGKSGAVDITATAATRFTRAGSTIYAASTDHLHADTTITIDGHAIGSFTAAGNTVDDVINAINGQQGVTGITASFVTNHIQLTSVAYGSGSGFGTAFDSGIAIGWGNSPAFGTDAQITAMSIGGAALTAPELATFSIRNGNTVSNAAGDSIVLAAGSTGGAGIATMNAGTPATSGGNGVASLAGGALSFQIGANAGETALVNISSTAADKLGTGLAGNAFTDVSKIDVTVNATDAIKVLDAAIAQVSTQRASLGAFQKNVLESNMNSLNVTNENVAASQSSIRDTDMAAEMTNFTRLNILAQAGIAMLTQSNQQPQQILSLLR